MRENFFITTKFEAGFGVPGVACNLKPETSLNTAKDNL